MQPNHDHPDTDMAQLAWSSQKGNEEEKMNIAISSVELSAMVESRQKLNTRMAWIVSAVALSIAAALLFNIYRIDQPWIRLGQAWTLGVIAYLIPKGFEKSRRRISAGEPCAAFLRLQHEERRRGYLLLRNRLFLFVPGMAACWWGARSLFVGKSPWSAGLAPSPWLFPASGVALALAWFAFGKAAQKAARDRDRFSALSENGDASL